MNKSLKGNLFCMSVLILGSPTWLTPENVDTGLKIITGLAAATAAVFTARFQWYATKEKKERIKKLKRDED